MLAINQNSQYKPSVSFGTTLKIDKKLLEKIPEASYMSKKVNNPQLTQGAFLQFKLRLP